MLKRASNLKVGVSLDHGVSLRFVSLLALWTCWETFQTKSSARNAPASSALTLVSHWSHSAHTTNRHLHCRGERNGAQRRTKVSCGRTMMQPLELLRLVKRHISRWSDIEQWRNLACSYSHYWVTFVWRHQLVSQSLQSVSQSIENSVKKIFINSYQLHGRDYGWSEDIFWLG